MIWLIRFASHGMTISNQNNAMINSDQIRQMTFQTSDHVLRKYACFKRVKYELKES